MAEDKKAPQEQKTQVKLKSGEYQVHIYLQEARGITPEEEGDTVDAMVTFSVFGSSKHSSVKDDVSSGATLFWGEHFFFNKPGLSVKEVEDSRILIEVRNHRALLSDQLVGNYTMDLSFVYFREKHSLVHQWVALSNPESKEFSKVRGHLKLGVCVQAEGDSDVDLAVREKNEPKDSDVMLPPQVNIKSVQLIVRVIKAEGLPKMDGWNGTIDAFCSVDFAGAKISSTPVQADSSKFTAYWFEDLYLPVKLPALSSRVMLKVWDYDLGNPDDLVGSMSFCWDDIAAGRYGDYFWTNIYGAPKELDNEEAMKMNNIPEIASKWRGRILLRITLEEPKKPQMDKKKIDDKNIAAFIRDNYESVVPYQIRCQAFYGSVLSAQFKKYSLAVSWCGKIGATKQNESVRGTCVWNEVFKRKIVKVPGRAELALPDVFVYLRHDDLEVAFARVPASEWMDLMAGHRWVSLWPDKAIGKIKKEWEGGMVLVRVFVGIFDSSNENLAVGRWNIPPRPKKGESIRLVANMYQCKNLPAADSDGKSDPYIKVTFQGFEAQSEVKENTLNPMWYSRATLQIPNYIETENPPLVVYVFDDDLTSDDLIGRAVMDLSRASVNSDQPTPPEWVELALGKSKCGMILISFNVYKGVEVPQYSIVPQCMDVQVQINSLGLRDLQPAIGFLPVNKPFIKFDLNSLQIPGENLVVRNVETAPIETGANPNISSVIQFEIKMPIDPLYSPVLTATVYDILFRGLSQPQIGTFTIDLGAIYHAKKKSEYVAKSAKREEETPDEKQRFRRPTLQEAIDEAFVVYPEYTLDKKGKMAEKFKPEGDFVQVGYDRKFGDKIMHYRFQLDTEMENSEYLEKCPFDKFTLLQGQERGDDSFLLSLFGGRSAEVSSVREVGIFKGIVKVNKLSKYERKESRMQVLAAKGKLPAGSHPLEPDIISDIIEDKNIDLHFEEMKRLILKKTTLIVRVYILECFNLAQKDWKSNSDPYIRIKLGKQVFDDQANYQSDEPNPKIYKHFDLKTQLPGASRLKIQVWDDDPIVSDQKIGETVIDLEDRFFSSNWRNMDEKPIETRGLYLKTSKMQQGSIKLWLELLDPGLSSNPRDISMRPPAEFEVRFIVWKTKGVASYDVEATSDIYVRAWVNEAEAKETDTHFRCQNGKAEFNWRMKFMLKLPCAHCYCNLQLWDRDVISASDFIGDASFSFSELAKLAFEKEARLKKQDEGGSEKVWVPCLRKKEDGDDENVGEVLVSLELVPIANAAVCPVGEGRSDPNIDPFLPPPLGRFKWS